MQTASLTCIPRTDLEVSSLCLGTWSLAGGFNWGPQEESDSLATIHAALDQGVNFLDTAPIYGEGSAETLVGKALKEKPAAEVVLASKVSFKELKKDALVASCEASLKRLRRDTIDLLQVHWPNHDIPFDETVSALEQLKSEGKIRAYGVCNFNAEDLKTWKSAGGDTVTNQVPYSLLWRAIEHEILPACREAEIGILCYSPLMQGLLSGKFESPADVPEERARTRHFSSGREHARHGEAGAESETFSAITTLKQTCEAFGYTLTQAALTWLMHQPGVLAPIIGPRSPEQLDASLASLDLKPSDSFLIQLAALTEPLKIVLGTNPDPWESPGRF